jgi:hypothetical protein
MVLYEPPVAVTGRLGGEALLRSEAALKAGCPGRALQIHFRDIVEAPESSSQSCRCFGRFGGR